jgi:hypothetical protein
MQSLVVTRDYIRAPLAFLLAMAHRKQLPQPRTCAQCATVFLTARKGHLYCSSACNTRAWRQRKPLKEPVTNLKGAATETEAEATKAVKSDAVTLRFNASNIGTVAVGTAMGNLFSAAVQNLLSPAALFPTWPPAELLKAAQAPRWVEDPAWQGQLWLTPTTYLGHTLHLYAEAGMPYVLWQAPNGEWRVLTSPADLAQLAAIRPISSKLRALNQQYGIPMKSHAIGLPLPATSSLPQQLDS